MGGELNLLTKCADARGDKMTVLKLRVKMAKLMLRHKAKMLSKKVSSAVLKAKAKVYQYTGIYLAKKEENNMLKSKWFWSRHLKIKSRQLKLKKSMRMSDQAIQGLIVGTWQMQRGMYRVAGRLSFSDNRLLRLFIPAEVFYLQLKYDLQKLKKK